MPADMRRQAGVLVEPLACAIHAVERAAVELGDSVVLAGAGPIGLLMLSVLRLKHPALVVVTDVKPERLELARQLGADVTMNVREQDPGEAVRELTGGYGCDVSIEATGYPEAVVQGLDAVRKLGRMVVFGVFGRPATVDWSIVGDRKELDGPAGPRRDPADQGHRAARHAAGDHRQRGRFLLRVHEDPVAARQRTGGVVANPLPATRTSKVGSRPWRQATDHAR